MNCETASIAPPVSSRLRFIFPGIIVKDSQVYDFAGQEFGVLRGIRAGNAQQHQHTRADFPSDGSLHFNFRVSNTLDHGTHTGECTLTDSPAAN